MYLFDFAQAQQFKILHTYFLLVCHTCNAISTCSFELMVSSKWQLTLSYLRRFGFCRGKGGFTISLRDTVSFDQGNIVGNWDLQALSPHGKCAPHILVLEDHIFKLSFLIYLSYVLRSSTSTWIRWAVTSGELRQLTGANQSPEKWNDNVRLTSDQSGYDNLRLTAVHCRNWCHLVWRKKRDIHEENSCKFGKYF